MYGTKSDICPTSVATSAHRSAMSVTTRVGCKDTLTSPSHFVCPGAQSKISKVAPAVHNPVTHVRDGLVATPPGRRVKLGKRCPALETVVVTDTGNSPHHARSPTSKGRKVVRELEQIGDIADFGCHLRCIDQRRPCPRRSGVDLGNVAGTVHHSSGTVCMCKHLSKVAPIISWNTCSNRLVDLRSVDPVRRAGKDSADGAAVL